MMAQLFAAPARRITAHEQTPPSPTVEYVATRSACSARAGTYRGTWARVTIDQFRQLALQTYLGA